MSSECTLASTVQGDLESGASPNSSMDSNPEPSVQSSSSPQKSMSRLLSLPDELLIQIYQDLDKRDLKSLRLTASFFSKFDTLNRLLYRGVVVAPGCPMLTLIEPASRFAWSGPLRIYGSRPLSSALKAALQNSPMGSATPQVQGSEPLSSALRTAFQETTFLVFQPGYNYTCAAQRIIQAATDQGLKISNLSETIAIDDRRQDGDLTVQELEDRACKIATFRQWRQNELIKEAELTMDFVSCCKLASDLFPKVTTVVIGDYLARGFSTNHTIGLSRFQTKQFFGGTLRLNDVTHVVVDLARSMDVLVDPSMDVEPSAITVGREIVNGNPAIKSFSLTSRDLEPNDTDNFFPRPILSKTVYGSVLLAAGVPTRQPDVDVRMYNVGQNGDRSRLPKGYKLGETRPNHQDLAKASKDHACFTITSESINLEDPSASLKAETSLRIVKDPSDPSWWQGLRAR